MKSTFSYIFLLTPLAGVLALATLPTACAGVDDEELDYDSYYAPHDTLRTGPKCEIDLPVEKPKIPADPDGGVADAQPETGPPDAAPKPKDDPVPEAGPEAGPPDAAPKKIVPPYEPIHT